MRLLRLKSKISWRPQFQLPPRRYRQELIYIADGLVGMLVLDERCCLYLPTVTCIFIIRTKGGMGDDDPISLAGGCGGWVRIRGGRQRWSTAPSLRTSWGLLHFATFVRPPPLSASRASAARCSREWQPVSGGCEGGRAVRSQTSSRGQGPPRGARPQSQRSPWRRGASGSRRPGKETLSAGSSPGRDRHQRR